jgi:hypothetical protein
MLIVVLLSSFSAAAQDERQVMRLLGSRARLLYPEELHGNCAGLTVTIRTHIDRLRELKKKADAERQGPPTTLFGGRPAADAFAEERDRVEALNLVLDAKACDLVNIEDELKKAPASPLPPKAGQHPSAKRGAPER